VPGYIWAPSWVVWRANNDYVGWLPMPPGYLDYQQLLTSPYLTDRWYGYLTFYGPLYGPTFITEHYFTLWVFVLKDDLIYRHGVRHVSDIRQLRSLYYGSADCTQYVVDQDRMVDRSIDRNVWRRSGERIAGARPARDHVRAEARGVSVSRGREMDRQQAEVRNRRLPAQQRAANGSVSKAGPQRRTQQDSASPARSEREPRGTMSEARASLRERRAVESPNAPDAQDTRTRIAPAVESGTLANEPRPDRSVSAPGARALARPDRPSTDRQTAGDVSRGISPIPPPRPVAPLTSSTARATTRASPPITTLGSTARAVTGAPASASAASPASASSTSPPGASRTPAAPVPTARSSARSSVSRSGTGAGAARGSLGRGF
jgi:hypothetical protein